MKWDYWIWTHDHRAIAANIMSQAKMQAIGQAGWELVAVHTANDATVYYFKRPIVEART